ncbi:methylated-DNA--[protein]-cysteine S-methyltransferase [Corynebacterium mayonis]|uniref:methylated-DNA--[protein]-cysteine S-methyltransferase n=1 Tax=Corynebacterium mayonis TaxID=3062461 RepID=UPI0031400E81
MVSVAANGEAGTAFCRCVVDSPVGELTLVFSAAGLYRVLFAAESGLGRGLAQVEARNARQQFAEYFAGERRAFTLPLDLGASSGFYRRVQEELLKIPYGRTVGYGDLARRLGSAGASRAVGTGCAQNPLPIVVPCHRVVRADGSVGNYRGGGEAKVFLLGLEAGLQRGT